MRLANFSFAGLLISVLCLTLAPNCWATGPESVKVEIVPTPTDGGIKEDVPGKYRKRFERWKAELLSTEIGRRQWETYAGNKQFVLTIKVSRGRGKGAGTDKFQWDDEGRFVGATITLGADLDEGYPTAIYYPVLNSLSNDQTTEPISGNILAATKMSHEIGHIIQTERANVSQLQTQFRLIPIYTSIFLSNGFNSRDEKLVELAEKIGGTPIEIWESREYWSEVNAMYFLQERIKYEDFYCHVFKRIKRNVETYARGYSDRFDPPTAPCVK